MALKKTMIMLFPDSEGTPQNIAGWFNNVND